MSTPQLRPFQAKLVADIESAWASGAQNVMPVAATGSGKTVVLAHMAAKETGGAVAIAHRQELVSQISTAFARNGLEHRLLSTATGRPSPLMRMITALHTFEFGRSYLNERAPMAVAGVDMLMRHKGGDPFFDRTRLVIQDEAHHVLRDNKWGKAAALFPNARGLYPTATPCRADGKGLGRHAHGIIDAMVLAPTMRDIINSGYLTDYRIIIPTTSKFNRSAIEISASTSEFNKDSAIAEVKRAQIVGDVVDAYKAYAMGTRAVVFCVTVEESENQAQRFRDNGIPAAALSAESSDSERHATLQKLRTGEIQVVTNVDLFGEGFDLPAIETVIFARPTKSFGLYSQQFGRCLRLMLTKGELDGYNDLSDEQRRARIALSGKPAGIIVDLVGNVDEHRLPDSPRIWTLDARDRKGNGSGRNLDTIPLRTCTSCMQPYERIEVCCPYCGTFPEIKGRGTPEQVDGDLFELSPEVLAKLRGEIARVDGACHVPQNVPHYVAAAIRKKHEERQAAQSNLRNGIAWWAGYWGMRGDSEANSYRRFYHQFGVDVASAQSLGRPEAEELAKRIHKDMTDRGVDSTIDALAWGFKHDNV